MSELQETGRVVAGPRGLALAVAALLMGGCASSTDQRGEGRVTFRDSAGVTLVRNAREAAASDCIMIGPDPRLTIQAGLTRGDTRPPLFRAWGGVVLADGSIVLLNAGTQHLLFFSESGDYRYAVGGQGGGPGEFQAPDWLGRGSGDTLYVWDSRAQRLSVFSRDGVFLTSRRVPHELSTVRGMFEDGSFLVKPISVVYVTGDDAVKRDPETYLRYDPQTEAVNYLANGLSGEWVDAKEGARSLPFGKRTVFEAFGTLVVVGDNADAMLRYVDLGGQLRRIVSWASEPVAVTSNDERSYVEHQNRQAQGSTDRARIQLPDIRPRFSAIQADRMGFLWVKEYAADWEPPSDWLVFDNDGVLVCRVSMPSRFGVYEIGEDYILGRQTSDLDEESVVLFDLTRRLP